MTPAFSAIIDAACEQFGASRAEVLGPRRYAHLVDARSAAAWAARKRLRHGGYSAIGRMLGGRDHSTIISVVKRAEKLRSDDPDFRALSDAVLAAGMPQPTLWEARA